MRSHSNKEHGNQNMSCSENLCTLNQNQTGGTFLILLITGTRLVVLDFNCDSHTTNIFITYVIFLI